MCAYCGKEFCRNPGESVEPFLVRKTCCRTCCDAKRKADHQKSMEQTSKECPVCGSLFYRRKGTESRKQFTERKTCGTACGHVARQSKWTEKSPNGKLRSLEYEAARKKAQAEKDHLLPPSTPLDREIPEAPQPTEVTVWRPDSWGGPRIDRVG